MKSRLLHILHIIVSRTILFLLVALLLPSFLPQKGFAQELIKVNWQRVDDGRNAGLKKYDRLPLDSLGFVIASLIKEDQADGYYFSQLDSVAIGDTLNSPVLARLFMRRGERVDISAISWSGLTVFAASEIQGLFSTRVRQVFSELTLQEDIDRLLRAYEMRGYPFAIIQVDSVSVTQEEGEPGLHIAMKVEEGARVKINDIVLSGGKRTSIAYVERVTGLKRGDWLDRDLDEVQRLLQASQFFQQVQVPQLIVLGGEDVIVQIPVVEEAPGSFDLVLGYQPPAASSQSQGLVGNGHLALRNIFGRGRRISLRINRLPGQISSVSAGFVDPFLFQLPFSLEGNFEGLQQDSTYGQQAYRGAVGYKMAGGLETFLTISREVTRPGQAGLRLENGTQRIPRSEIVFAGLSIRYSRLDQPLNPQRGVFVETQLERGSKTRRSFQLGIDADTASTAAILRQERLTLSGRLFVPTWRNQVFVVGNDTRVLISDTYDISDLFRLGGAQSLRGYDEDRFRGRLVSRSLIEYRYLFERRSYAYLFFDLGYVDRPATPDLESMQAYYPGYGLGMQFSTGIGLINTSLALSTDENPSQAKVHVGLSLGL